MAVNGSQWLSMAMVVNGCQWQCIHFIWIGIYFSECPKSAQFLLVLSIYLCYTIFSHPLLWWFRKRMKISRWSLGTAPLFPVYKWCQQRCLKNNVHFEWLAYVSFQWRKGELVYHAQPGWILKFDVVYITASIVSFTPTS